MLLIYIDLWKVNGQAPATGNTLILDYTGMAVQVLAGTFHSQGRTKTTTNKTMIWTFRNDSAVITALKQSKGITKP